MEISKKETVNINAKTLKIHLKVRDRFTASLVSDSGNIIYNQLDGYVPDFMPDDHFGDYVILDIDIDTGQITNWTQPYASEIEEWIKEDDE